jgi:hypothetical protein
MVKANIDLAEGDGETLAALSEAIGPALGDMFWTRYENPRFALNGFQSFELLPGDEVWFDNPYWDLAAMWGRNYGGEEGSNVFYIGDGKIMNLYPPHDILSIQQKRDQMQGGHWKSAQFVRRLYQIAPWAYAPEIVPVEVQAKYRNIQLLPVNSNVFRILVRNAPKIFVPAWDGPLRPAQPLPE